MVNATAALGYDSRLGTTVGQNLFSEEQDREQLSAVICKFTPRQIAKVTHCSADAAKKWIAGERLANTTNTLNMALSLPCVQLWVADRAGIQRAAQARSLDGVIAWATAHRLLIGPDGDMARAILFEAATNRAPAQAAHGHTRSMQAGSAEGAGAPGSSVHKR